MNAMNPMNRQPGFTLAELAIALVIFSLLIGGMFVSISTQLESRRISDTQKTLDQVREALIGFLVANGRLPCPAASGATGVELPAGGGVCTNPYNGFVPAITLGLTPTNTSGYLLDGWGYPVRYAVTASDTSAFTTAAQIRALLIDGNTATPAPNLRVCTTSACATVLVNDAPAVIFSTGSNGGLLPATGGADEAENTDNDITFVQRERTIDAASNAIVFDDVVTWLSQHVLYNRLIAAGAI